MPVLDAVHLLSIYIGISRGDNMPTRATIIDIIAAQQEKEFTLSIKGNDGLIIQVGFYVTNTTRSVSGQLHKSYQTYV